MYQSPIVLSARTSSLNIMKAFPLKFPKAAVATLSCLVVSLASLPHSDLPGLVSVPAVVTTAQADQDLGDQAGAVFRRTVELKRTFFPVYWQAVILLSFLWWTKLLTAEMHVLSALLYAC